MDLLEKVWIDLKQYLPTDPGWAQLCNHVERICATALLRLGISRKLPRNSHKGDVPMLQIKTSHHRTRPEGPDSVKLARLRRLWRRMTAWHHQHISTCDLKRAISREASWFGCLIIHCPGTAGRNVLLGSLKTSKTTKPSFLPSESRTGNKKSSPMNKMFGHGSEEIRKSNLFSVFLALKDWLLTIEQFWRRHWPTTPSDVPPITGWDFEVLHFRNKTRPLVLTAGAARKLLLYPYQCLIFLRILSTKLNMAKGLAGSAQMLETGPYSQAG